MQNRTLGELDGVLLDATTGHPQVVCIMEVKKSPPDLLKAQHQRCKLVAALHECRVELEKQRLAAAPTAASSTQPSNPPTLATISTSPAGRPGCAAVGDDDDGSEEPSTTSSPVARGAPTVMPAFEAAGVTLTDHPLAKRLLHAELPEDEPWMSEACRAVSRKTHYRLLSTSFDTFFSDPVRLWYYVTSAPPAATALLSPSMSLLPVLQHVAVTELAKALAVAAPRPLAPEQRFAPSWLEQFSTHEPSAAFARQWMYLGSVEYNAGRRMLASLRHVFEKQMVRPPAPTASAATFSAPPTAVCPAEVVAELLDAGCLASNVILVST
jgi:hypothetical protein